MALSKSILVSDYTSQQNLVNKYKCGLVFSEKNPIDLADKIIAIEQDNNFYKELSRNAFNAIKENLNWKITSKNLITIYKK